MENKDIGIKLTYKELSKLYIETALELHECLLKLKAIKDLCKEIS